MILVEQLVGVLQQAWAAAGIQGGRVQCGISGIRRSRNGGTGRWRDLRQSADREP